MKSLPIFTAYPKQRLENEHLAKEFSAEQLKISEVYLQTNPPCEVPLKQNKPNTTTTKQTNKQNPNQYNTKQTNEQTKTQPNNQSKLAPSATAHGNSLLHASPTVV